MGGELDFGQTFEEDPGLNDEIETLVSVDPSEPGGGGEVVAWPDDSVFADLEYGPAMTLVDSDYSGFWNHAVIDVDGDGVANVIASVQGSGVIVMVDVQGDGHFDSTEFLTIEELAQLEPQLAEFLAPQLTYVPPEGAVFEPVEVDYETTISESPYWFQQAANGLCVPASVAQIVAEYSGIVFESEAEFVELANQYGLFWVGPDGVPSMSAEGALLLLEQAGVPASMIVSANFDMLDAYVDAGHGVVLAVSSSEIWAGASGSGSADHALVVTGIDREAGIAVLSDPGHPDGNGFTVSIEVLEEAWAAGGNTMIVAEQPADGSYSPGVPGIGSGSDAALGVEGITPTGPGTPASDGIVIPGLDRSGPGLPGSVLPGGDGSMTPQLHSTVAQATAWAVRRPWVLLPVAIAASRLVAR